MTKRLVRILVYSSCALLFAGEAAQPAPPVAQQKSSQPARSVAAKGTPKPAPVPAVLTPTPLVMAMHQLNLKITKSEVLENIKTPFETIAPPPGMRLVVVTLSGTADRDYSPVGLVPDVFRVVYKNEGTYESATSGAISWFGDMWISGRYKVSSASDIKKGPVQIRVAVGLPPETRSFSLCIPTPLPETRITNEPKP